MLFTSLKLLTRSELFSLRGLRLFKCFGPGFRTEYIFHTRFVPRVLWLSFRAVRPRVRGFCLVLGD